MGKALTCYEKIQAMIAGRLIHPGDSCHWNDRKYYIKSIGHKYTVLITISDYIKYGLRGRNLYHNHIPKGFRVKTQDISHIRFNYWNV